MIYQGVELYNVAETLDDGGGGVLLLRVPDALRRCLNRNAANRVSYPAGSEIRCNLEGASARVVLRSEGAPKLAVVYLGPFFVKSCLVGVEPTEIVLAPPPDPALLRRAADKSGARFDPALIRLVLPYNCPLRLLGITVEGGRVTPPRPGQAPARKYLAYGSSITQGRVSVLPDAAYAPLTAARLGADLLNLGFRGGAHCEPEVADYLAERDDWDFATLEMGINMVRQFETAEFARRVAYFIPRVARAHPDKWLFCLGMFAFGDDLGPGRRKDRRFREIVRETVEALGSRRVVYLDGLKLLRDYSGLAADMVHPSPAGMAEISRNLSRAIARRMK